MLLIGYLYKSTAFKQAVTLIKVYDDGRAAVWYHGNIYIDVASRLIPTNKENKKIKIKETKYFMIVEEDKR